MRFTALLGSLLVLSCFKKENETELFQWQFNVDTESNFMGFGVGDSDRMIKLVGTVTNKTSKAFKSVWLKIEYARDGKPLEGHGYSTEIKVDVLGPKEARRLVQRVGTFSSDWNGVTPKITYLRHEE